MSNLEELYKSSPSIKAIFIGNILILKKAIFTNEYFLKASVAREEYIKVKITSTTYDSRKRHWVNFTILESTDKDLVSKKIRMQGKNIYRNGRLVQSRKKFRNNNMGNL